MTERTAEQASRGGWRPGFYMKPKHVGLVFCVSMVGCMVTFGSGFIVGMGYKASEQVSPYVVKKSSASESSEPGKVGPLSFYERLMLSSDESFDDLLPPGETARESEPTPAAPIPDRQAPTAVAEGTGLDRQAVDPADALSRGAAASVVETYSVQVASFLTPERAARLIEKLTEKGYNAYVHPFEAPGQPMWYRVKVGKYADRDKANRALEELGTSGAMITRN